MKERPPFRVNSWWNPKTDDRGEVWYNGKDGYNFYLNDERVDTWYIPQVPEWTPTHSNLLAVGEACRVGFKLTMKCDWEAYNERLAREKAAQGRGVSHG